MARKKASIKSFILGMLFGILLLLGSVAYGGYWTYTSLTINEFERLTKQQVSFIAQESVLRTLTIENMIGEVTKVPDMSFQEFSDTYQIELPAEVSSIVTALNDIKIKEISVDNLLNRVKIGVVLGTPYSDFETYGLDYAGEMPEGAESLLWEFRNYTISGDTGLSNYVDNLTVGSVKTVFNLTFPSFINIADTTPLSELGTEIENLTVASFFADITVTDSLSTSLLNAITSLEKEDNGEMRGYRISEFGELLNELPREIKIKDIIEAPAEGDTSPVAVILRKIITDSETGTDYTLDQINDLFDGLGDDVLLREIIAAPSATADSISTNLINKIRDMKDTDSNYYTINDMSTVFEALPAQLTIQDLMDDPGTGTVATNILHDIWFNNASLTNLSGSITGVIDDMHFQDLFTAPIDTTTVGGRILNDIYVLNPSITAISPCIISVINDLTLQDVIAEPVQGTIFGNIMYKLYDKDIKITELSTELSDEDFLIKDILILPTDTTTISYRIISLISGVNPDNDPTDPDDDYYTLNQMPQAIDNAINDLTIGDLFSEGEQTGLVSLFGAETKIVDFNSAGVASSLGDKTLEQLQIAGLISGVTSPELLSKTLNGAIEDLNTLHP